MADMELSSRCPSRKSFLLSHADAACTQPPAAESCLAREQHTSSDTHGAGAHLGPFSANARSPKALGHSLPR